MQRVSRVLVEKSVENVQHWRFCAEIDAFV